MQGLFAASWQPAGFDARALLSLLFGGASDLGAWGLGVARVLPAVSIIPAFGLSAVATPIRIGLGLAQALSVLPAVQPTLIEGVPWAVAFGLEFMRGLPLALEASAVLWAANMAGGLLDNLRGARESEALPLLDEPAPPLALLLSLLAALAFLESGGASRVAAALTTTAPLGASPFQAAALDLTRAIELSIGIAAPLAAVSIVIEVSAALIARAASPAHVQALIAPLRSLALLAITALVIERIVALLALLSAGVPH